MPERNGNATWRPGRALLGSALLLVALLAAYANHFHNSFHFDDAHTVVNNASIQTMRNVPLFFRDATTFSSLPSNQSYRPLVSTLLALAYYFGGGLDPFWFHILIFTLFSVLTLLLSLVIHRLLEQATSSPANRWVALAGAAWFGLHPANADTVNYIIASSEVISTLGVIASFAVYLVFPQWRRSYVYVLPAAIAILAKPPAAIFAILFATYRLLFPSDNGRNITGARGRTFWAEIIVPLMICAGMLLLVQKMTPPSWVAGATNARSYLMTQPYVALLYFKTFFWPSGLSADYDLNPFSSTNDPRLWIGCAFIVLLASGATWAARFKKTRVIGFGLLWFFVALLSTSALPLAEVMNDHRTFFPYIGLIIAAAGAAALILRRRIAWSLPGKAVVICAITLFLCANGWATWQRNKVWRTEETLWHDVVLKSPRNGRGLMNYGNTLMARGDYEGALDYFHRAQVLTPRYPVLFINLALAEAALGQTDAAEKHFAEALRLAPANPDSYTYYARYLLSHSHRREARVLLRSALELSPMDLTLRELVAQADAQTGDDETSQTPESYLALSLDLYREERYVESIVACRLALDLRPDYAEAWNNICAADNSLARFDEAVAACEQALRYKPDLELARNNLQYARARSKRAATR